MAKTLDFGSSLVEIEPRLSQNNFHRCQKSKAIENTAVKNFPLKITMERILFIVIAETPIREVVLTLFFIIPFLIVQKIISLFSRNYNTKGVQTIIQIVPT